MFASREQGPEAANIKAFSEQTARVRDSHGASRAGSAAVLGHTTGACGLAAVPVLGRQHHSPGR